MEYIETIIGIIIFLFVIVYFIAQDSNKETKKERYGEAIGYLAKSAADTIAGVAHDIAEPANKKQIRLAREELADRNGRLYRFEYYSHKEEIERLLTVDERFEKSLDTLGLSEERWRKIGLHLFYVGAIRYLSRSHNDYTQKNSNDDRAYILYEWINHELLLDSVKVLKKALAYFNISVDEWIKYGDTVIEMYNINDNTDIKEFGFITQIMPMRNNRHLL